VWRQKHCKDGTWCESRFSQYKLLDGDLIAYKDSYTQIYSIIDNSPPALGFKVGCFDISVHLGAEQSRGSAMARPRLG
jgi:hypothetical protein